MLVRDLKNCKEFVSGDGAVLRELLHPDKDDIKIHYSFAQARVLPGQTTFPHRLKSTEVYYILEGNGLMHIGKECTEVYKGCAVYIPPDAVQYIENTGKSDLIFICIVEPAWRKEDEEILG